MTISATAELLLTCSWCLATNISDSTGPGPASPVQHHFSSVREHFLDQTWSMDHRLHLLLFISYKPYFTSATKKKLPDQ